MVVQVRAHPRASRERVEWDGAVLHVWVSEPAAEGAANRALLKAIAGVVRVAPSRLRLREGRRSRDKRVEIPDLDPSRLEALSPGRDGDRMRAPHERKRA